MMGRARIVEFNDASRPKRPRPTVQPPGGMAETRTFRSRAKPVAAEPVTPVRSACLTLARSPRSAQTIAKSCDEPALPWGLDRMPVIVCPHVLDRLRGRDTVEDREARQRRSRTTSPTATGNLDPLSLGALPDLDQSVACVVGIGRHPEVAPAHPT
jgi:hypothetical protein